MRSSTTTIDADSLDIEPADAVLSDAAFEALARLLLDYVEGVEEHTIATSTAAVLVGETTWPHERKLNVQAAADSDEAAGAKAAPTSTAEG